MGLAPRNMTSRRLPNILRLFATKTLYITIEVEVISSSCYNRSLEFLPRLGFYTTKFILIKMLFADRHTRLSLRLARYCLLESFTELTRLFSYCYQ